MGGGGGGARRTLATDDWGLVSKETVVGSRNKCQSALSTECDD